MRVLITGLTGFVGSHLADFILANHPDVEIFGLKRWRSPLENVAHIMDKITLYDCDLRDLSSLMSQFESIKPDVIFHLAAQSYVPVSYVAPVDTLTTNVIGTANLLEAIRILGIDPLVHICSSSEVYGQVKPDEVPIRETNMFRPASPYAVSKVGEDMLGFQYFAAYGVKTVRTRMFTHTGPRRGEVFVCSNFAKQVADIEAGKQEPVVHVGNLDSVRTFTDVRDAVRAYWLLTEKYREGKVLAGDVYNIGGVTTMTIGEMLDKLLTFSPMGEKIKIVVDKDRLRPADVTLQIPSTDKFREATGWVPEVPFETTLQDLLDYWRKR
ncbi:MAG: GDP-mannose 4,6-dehydratase [Dehalococcoidales bacterium]|nr:GDP-mannose 4,6-dehydratase [Dehalococcoidales bacterium]